MQTNLDQELGECFFFFFFRVEFCWLESKPVDKGEEGETELEMEEVKIK